MKGQLASKYHWVFSTNEETIKWDIARRIHNVCSDAVVVLICHDEGAKLKGNALDFSI